MSILLEKAKNIAEEMDARRQTIIRGMLLSMSEIVNCKDITEWYYDTVNKTFSRSLEIGYHGKPLYNTEIRYRQFGVDYVATYDNYTQEMNARVYLPADSEHFANFVQELQEFRLSLRKKWLENAAKVANDYFQRNKKRYCDATLAYTSGIRSRNFCLWAPYKGKENQKMISLIGCLVNGTNEYLDPEQYTPCFWSSKDSLAERIRLNKNFVLVITRGYVPDENMLVDWPQVHASFEMVASDDMAFKNALSTIYYYNKCQAHQHFEDFEKNLNEAEWMKQVDGKLTAYIPVIWNEDIDYIIKNASKRYPEFNFENAGVRYVPMFDGENVCVKVTEK